MDKLLGEATVVGFSGDNEFCKKAWKESLPDTLGGIRHTLLADCGLKLSHELGIVDFANLVALRATYIVDPEDKIQHVSVNALDTGRSADEVLRTVQGLKAGGLTGCSWNPGDPYVV
jgi:peroxiredoxin (alkyl hydroperoxide reductase subunit C)